MINKRIERVKRLDVEEIIKELIFDNITIIAFNLADIYEEEDKEKYKKVKYRYEVYNPQPFKRTQFKETAGCKE